MAALYIGLCILIAITLNAANRWIRVAGTSIAGASVFMISISILLANFDGTFACGTLDRTKPIVLDLQAAGGLVATSFLAWAAWTQAKRPNGVPVQIRNTKARFGLVSRYAHWTTAALMLLLIPMGLFLSVLPPSGDRASFLAAHQALGLTVLVVVILRIAWLTVSPPPPHDDLPLPQRRLAVTAHVSLYGLIIGFPLSGFMMVSPGNEEVSFYAWVLPSSGLRQGSSMVWRMLHDFVLPVAFYVVIFMHVGAVLKHHFADRRATDVRRMLT